MRVTITIDAEVGSDVFEHLPYFLGRVEGFFESADVPVLMLKTVVAGRELVWVEGRKLLDRVPANFLEELRSAIDDAEAEQRDAVEAGDDVP